MDRASILDREQGSLRSNNVGDTWPYLSLPFSLTICLVPIQRFRFCGDLDCPDWVLAEISTLAKIVECTGSSWELGKGGVVNGDSGNRGW